VTLCGWVKGSRCFEGTVNLWNSRSHSPNHTASHPDSLTVLLWETQASLCVNYWKSVHGKCHSVHEVCYSCCIAQSMSSLLVTGVSISPWSMSQLCIAQSMSSLFVTGVLFGLLTVCMCNVGWLHIGRHFGGPELLRTHMENFWTTKQFCFFQTYVQVHNLSTGGVLIRLTVIK
jgi:hypothetical protein